MTTTPVNGAAIRAIRERSGLSIRDVVALLLSECNLQAHEDHLRNVETGARGASPRLAVALAQVLKVPTVAILASTPVQSESEAAAS